MTDWRPKIAITSGEPAGIGPDIILSVLNQAFDAHIIIIADPQLLQQRAAQLGRTVDITLITNLEDIPPHTPSKLYVWPVMLATASIPGQLNKANAAYVLQTLTLAGQFALSGQVDAIVTPPVHKGILCETGQHFSGHTEFFQQQCHVDNVVMMLATTELRVALATTHLPLRAVADHITRSSLSQVLTILHRELKDKFAIPSARILVCGLNPHAGEDGHLGREELDIIEPALADLRLNGMDLIGPLPADTLFTPKYLSQCDCVLAMYHDQGLPVLKYQGFGSAVNITLGLPIIRTSVDHGTALDLAASGNANDGSLRVAIDHAIKMANNQKRISHE